MALSTLLNHTNVVATISGGIFAGASAYISFSEVPALNKSGPNEMWRFFPYMYSNAAKMQAALATISGTTGIIYAFRVGDSSPLAGRVWLGAALCFVGIIPYTIFLMMPTNMRIIQSNKTLEDEAEKKALLTKWSKMHLVRTVVSAAGFSAMVYALVKYS